MELREWLIILGLVLVTIIAFDGMRRLQRQRRVPRLDQVAPGDDSLAVDPEEAARQAQIKWELPYGGPRVVRPAMESMAEKEPDLQAQEFPASPKWAAAADEASVHESPTYKAESTPSRSQAEAGEKAENETPSSSGRFSRAGMSAALRAGSQRVSKSMQQVSTALHGEESEHSHREPSLGQPLQAASAGTEPELAKQQSSYEARPEVADTPTDTLGSHLASEPAPIEPIESAEPSQNAEPTSSAHEGVVTPHPIIEKAQRHHVSARRASETLAHFEEVIVISVMARNEEGFSGPDLLNLMLACGLRYSEMGIFLRYETEDAESELQFAMVDVVKPGTFDLAAMDDFATPGVTFLMPLPSARDSAAAFEAMVETAMVLVRNLGGELKDENRSVMTAQTVEFARQRVQEFERRHRLHRYQVN